MTKSIFFILAAAALSVACTKEMQEQVNRVPGRTVIMAEVPAPATGDSRTEMGDKSGNSYPTYWTVGDRISINGCSSLPLASDDIGSDARTARFDVDGIIDAPFKAVYPLGVVASYDKGAYAVTLPATQNYTEGSFDPAAAVMLAKGTSSLPFQNVMSYLKLTVTQGSTNATIKSLRVVARGGEAMSGDFDAVFEPECALGKGYTTSSAVNVDCGDGIALGTPIVVAIPAVTYTQGFDIYVYTTDKKFQKATSTLSFNAVKGKIYSTGFNYSETGTAIGIWTEQDLKDFLAAADGGVACSTGSSTIAKASAPLDGIDYSAWTADDGKVHIYADITLNSKVDWSATVANRSNVVSFFDGYIDGEGHTITIASGKAWTTAMFMHLYGTIANLNFAGAFKADHAANLSSPIVNVLEAGGCIDNVASYVTVSNTKNYNHYMSGIVSGMYGGTVSNCRNYGDITYSGSNSASGKYLAGIVAYAYDQGSDGIIENCTNYGNIVSTVTKSSDGSYFVQAGGVVSYAGRGIVEVRGCANRAEVFNAGTASQVGGVICSARADISDCHNYCPIVVPADNTASVGGVVNWDGLGYTVSSCTNNTSITIGGSAHAGGVISDAYGDVEDCTNNGTFIFDGTNTSAYVGGVASRTTKSGSNAPGNLYRCRNTAAVEVGCAKFGGITAENIGGMEDCTNSGAVSFGLKKCSAAGVIYENKGTMTNCDNAAPVSCDKDSCNVAGVAIVLSNSGSMTNCDNSAPVTVTGNDSPAAGICFNLLSGGTITTCHNSGDINFTLKPAYKGSVSFAGGIVGIVSKVDMGRLVAGDILPQTGGSSGFYYQTTGHSGNTLTALTTISGCNNTGAINMTVTATNTKNLRNVAMAGIVAWNWAISTDDYYLHIYRCRNGVEGQAKGRLEYTQSAGSPYIAPAMGGILGQNAPYTIISNQSILCNTDGYSTGNVDSGMKVVIEECESYARIFNLGSFSNATTNNSNRNLRPAGGIAGVLVGQSARHAVVKGCTSAAYVAMGTTSGVTGYSNHSGMNCVGGIAGVAALADVQDCVINSSAADTYGIGSESRFVFASGGVFGAALEKYSITGCTLHAKQGYNNNQSYSYYGIAVGATILPNNKRLAAKGYEGLTGSEIKDNKVMPGVFKVNGSSLSITESNFGDYLISAVDAADNAANGWLTISGNTWE